MSKSRCQQPATTTSLTACEKAACTHLQVVKLNIGVQIVGMTEWEMFLSQSTNGCDFLCEARNGLSWSATTYCESKESGLLSDKLENKCKVPSNTVMEEKVHLSSYRSTQIFSLLLRLILGGGVLSEFSNIIKIIKMEVIMSSRCNTSGLDMTRQTGKIRKSNCLCENWDYLGSLVRVPFLTATKINIYLSISIYHR